MTVAPAETIRDLVEPVLFAAGLELWDVEVTPGMVRISVDRPGGVDLDALTTASNALSPLLDEHPELVPGRRYQLEVSSPGVERKLRTPEHYRRFVGSQVSVRTTVPLSGARRLRGRLAGAGPRGITLEPVDPPGSPVEIPYEQIDRARTVMAWGPSAAPRRAGRRADPSVAGTDGRHARR